MKRFMSLFLILCSIMMLFGGHTNAYASELTTPSGLAYSNIENEMDQFMEQYAAGLVSCEIAVFDQNGIITSKYYGFSDIENNVYADATTVYDWGSCSKILIWVSVMQQVERGNIDLDTDIREYLPEGFLTKLQYEDEKITMMNLMNHNAGFQESFYENQSCDKEEIYNNLEEALRACECYQAYHVGEYTAYSNYGAALAAFIVERVSGQDYRDYVRDNIFKPLNMEHTSIDPLITDNSYVKEKREELKCYYRGADSKYDKDYGICHSWVQLYPAGSVIGTLEDFAVFGQALASKDSVLFEQKSTWEEMLSPTSFYGNTDIAKNCHGLWTTEYKVQVVGHSGNTEGCTSNLMFDPVSGLGIVVMTNEPGETLFNFEIPSLLFGEITDREEYKDGYISDDKDVSGIYFSQRNIDQGSVSFFKYFGQIFPLNKNEDGNYNLAFGSFNIDPDTKLYKLANNQYLLDRNGMKSFMYLSEDDYGRTRLEMMSMDIITSKTDTAKMIFLFSIIILGIISIVALVIKLLVFVIRKIRKKNAKININILTIQVIYAASLVVMLTYLNCNMTCIPWFAAISAILALLLGLTSLINGFALVFRTVKERVDMKVRSQVHCYIWSVISFLYFVFIMTFQVYQFWTL